MGLTDKKKPYRAPRTVAQEVRRGDRVQIVSDDDGREWELVSIIGSTYRLKSSGGDERTVQRADVVRAARQWG